LTRAEHLAKPRLDAGKEIAERLAAVANDRPGLCRQRFWKDIGWAGDEQAGHGLPSTRVVEGF
jgi:hypothetical protein